MSSEICCMVIQPAQIDFDIFSLWLKGYGIDESIKNRLLKENEPNQSQHEDHKLLLADTLDCYRLFNIIEEKYLKNPPSLANQVMFDLSPNVQHRLIQEYYSFDKMFVRELLGKKISSRLRKDVDEIGEKVKISLPSCRRQVGNIRRVFKAVEDLDGSLIDNIRLQFLLSEELTRLYVYIIFMANNKFETGKKRQQYLTFNAFMECSKVLIENWTIAFYKDGSIEIDKSFIQDLRDLKALTSENIEQHRSLLTAKLKGKVNDKGLGIIGQQYKTIMRTSLSIATGLVHSREWKDFFNNIVERIVEPLKHTRLSKEYIKASFTSISETAGNVNMSDHLSTIYCRYLTVFTACVIYLY